MINRGITSVQPRQDSIIDDTTITYTGITVVIVTYNATRYIQKCLESIFSQKKAVNVVVVDNKSTDSTLSILRQHPCEVISLDENIGFGQANNIGINHALESKKCSHVFLLNQDAYLASEFFESFDSKHKAFQDSVIACLQLNGKGNALDRASEQFYLNSQSCPGFLNDTYFGQLKPIYTIEFMNAAAWIIPRRILELVGGFSPVFFHYGEDKNWINRLNFHNERLYLSSQCRVLHDRETRGKTEYQNEVFKHYSRALVTFSNPTTESSWLFFLCGYMLKIFFFHKGGLKWKRHLLLKLLQMHWPSIEKSRDKSRVANQYSFLRNND